MSDDNLAENLEESMAETLANIQEDQPEEYEDGHESEPERESGESDKAGSVRTRDEKGRFSSEDSIEEESSEEEGLEEEITAETPEKTIEAAPEVQEEQIQEEQIEPIDPRLERPPSTWRTDAKLKWEKVDPTIREEILKREEDIGRGITQYKQLADYGSAVEKTVQPYMPMITAAGSTPQQTIGSVLDTFYRLKTSDPVQKSQLLLQVAQQYGADMEVFQNGIDPNQAQLQNHLQPLQQEIQLLKQNLSQRDQQAQQFESSQAQTDINAFRNASDNGELMYPHFDIVREQMADIIESNERAGRNITLDTAYENAVWQTPEIRQMLLAEQSASKETIRRETVKQKTVKAQKANKINLQAKGSYDGKPVKPTGNLNDTLKDALNDIKNRDSE